MTSQSLADQAARTAIRTDLAHTLFVEAGAGSGKTSSLVDRVVATVLADDGVALRHVAAVTFTDKAGAELRDRLRASFEEAARNARASGDDEPDRRATAALDDLDSAAIGTLHSFAQRILGEHPIEAGLPPLIDVLDEVASQVRFDERWTALAAAILEDDALSDVLQLGLAAGVKLEHLRSIASDFNSEWDRLQAAVLDGPVEPAPSVDARAILRRARDLVDRESHCVSVDDLFLGHLHRLAEWATRLETAPDDPARMEILGDAAHLKATHGRRANWPGCDLEGIRAELRQVQADAAAIRQQVLDTVLRRLARRVAQDTVEAARARQQEGRLEFHDLLVLARELVTSSGQAAEVRADLQERYQRLLLDEFQDTDPIQIEIAVRIAGGAAAGAPDWRDVVVPEGRLFVVGDPKQSIYRFRRADITTYLEAQERIGRRERLTTNFRTTGTLLTWANHVFSRLITAEEGSQPPYQPLDRDRDDPPGGSRVVRLGRDAHANGEKADALRTFEAGDVGAAIAAAVTEAWPVFEEREGRWRDVRLGDIAVLVPARTSLPHLEDALDRAGIPYRAEASSLVYRTAEVRDLLMAARALDDPSDALALVSTLRSSLFGCGDDDLWTWKQAHGSFNLLAPPPPEVAEGHPVLDAVTYLRGLHDERTWRAPSEVLDRLVCDRRMLEAATDGPRTRDVWRRLRFVVDQARAWSEVEHGGLRGYLAWARRQGDESARVAEAVLPETDTDAVRILTIHAAKGLEFPVVIVSGMSSRPGGGRGGVEVLWPRDGGYEVRLGKSLQTGDFDVVKPLDEQMDHHERLRLLYVACTRARDHLVVSMHRSAGSGPARTNAELLAEAAEEAPGETQLVIGASDLATATSSPPLPPEPFDAWSARIAAARDAARAQSAISASSLEGTLALAPMAAELAEADGITAKADAGLAKGARNLELPPWNKGRYGSAIGRAVHGALQTVDLATGDGLEPAVAAQTLAEGVLEHEQVVLDLCRQALASETVRRAAARPHWRETYVGTTLDDGRVLEGFVDLVYRDDDDSLVVVDYKTDAVPSAALPARVRVYLPQMAAYAQALGRATGQDVHRATLLFLSPHASTAHELDASDWAGALPTSVTG